MANVPDGPDRERRPYMRSSTLTILAVTTFIAAGCTLPRPDPPELAAVTGSHNDQGGGALTVKAQTPYEFPMRNVCTRKGKPIQITAVTPWRPTGSIKIVDWGVRRSQGQLPGGFNVGAEPITVRQVGGFTTGPVTVKCTHTTEYQQFYVSVSTRTARSTMYGAQMHYGDGKIVDNQFAIALRLTKKCPGVTLDGS